MDEEKKIKEQREEDVEIRKLISEYFPNLSGKHLELILGRLYKTNTRRFGLSEEIRTSGEYRAYRERHNQGKNEKTGKLVHSHLWDALKMHKIFEALESQFPHSAKILEKAVLIHDIGKSGPFLGEGVPEEVRKNILESISYLFAYTGNPNLKTVEGVLLEKAEDAEKKIERFQHIIDYIGKNFLNLDMLKEFYPLHVEWGGQILEQIPSNQIPDNIKWIALNHHLISKGRRVEIGGFKPDYHEAFSAMFLEIVDIYEAAKVRGEKDDLETMDMLVNLLSDEQIKNAYGEKIDEEIIALIIEKRDLILLSLVDFKLTLD
jgi:hypothetical protein